MNNSLRAQTTFGRTPYIPPQRRLQSLATERVSFPDSSSINPVGGRIAIAGSHEEDFANVTRIAGSSASMVGWDRIQGRAATDPSPTSTLGAAAQPNDPLEPLASNLRRPAHVPVKTRPISPCTKIEDVKSQPSTGGGSDVPIKVESTASNPILSDNGLNSNHSLVSVSSFPSLESLNPALLADSRTLFYFGVLTIQTLLLPRFRFTREGGRWGVELTLYGYTISKPASFDTQIGAKVQVCREALELLKSRYPNWMVPGEPTDRLTASHWPWEKLLDGNALAFLISSAHGVNEMNTRWMLTARLI